MKSAIVLLALGCCAPAYAVESPTPASVPAIKSTKVRAAATTSVAEPLSPACELLIKSTEARASTSAWQSIAEVNGGSAILEAMKVDGQFFTRRNWGPWEKAPKNLDDAERDFISSLRNGKIKLKKCISENGLAVNGLPTTLVTFSIELPGAPVASAKLWVGTADGLPYKQEAKGLKISYTYKGIVAPKL